MRPIFQRTYETFAIYRLLVPLPVSVKWPSGDQTFEAAEQAGPPFGLLRITGPGSFKADHPFKSAAHVTHTLANGYKVTVPSVQHTFFARLVAEGRAAVVWGPHMQIYWLDSSITRGAPVVDAYYTFERGRTITSETHEWAAREADRGNHSAEGRPK